MAVIIKGVEAGSLAARKGIRPGDTLEAINGEAIRDVLDYRFYMTDSRLELSLRRDGAAFSVPVRKGEYDDLGLEFETYLMDRQHTCRNKCIFCFVDQLPRGLRDSLYVKDDDSRMSFLFGSYVTLTNLTEEDIRRIIKMRLSPINISVHTTDPDLRVEMLKNPKAAESLRYIPMLTQAGIRVNTQLVLCPGVNDGPALEKSLWDLAEYWPGLGSIALVPVGLTGHREGLYPLRPYTKEEARQVLDAAALFQAEMIQKHGSRIAYPADEFFLLAERPIPPAEYYEDFEQLEDGVGLWALLRQEFTSALELEEPRPLSRHRHRRRSPSFQSGGPGRGAVPRSEGHGPRGSQPSFWRGGERGGTALRGGPCPGPWGPGAGGGAAYPLGDASPRKGQVPGRHHRSLAGRAAGGSGTGGGQRRRPAAGRNDRCLGYLGIALF